MTGKILITGATGNVGSELITALRKRGLANQVVAADRNPAKAQAKLGNDIGYTRLDFADASSFAPAFTDIEKLFLMRPPALSDVPRYIAPAIDAAKHAGVRQIVFLSLLGAEKNRVVPHAKIEDALRDADVPWTMLRPSFFMQNLNTTHRDEIRDGNELFVPAGNGRTSFIDVRDIAAVAALALAEAGHEYQSYALTGSEALTYGEVAAMMTEVLGRNIAYRNPSLLAFIARWQARGAALDYILVMAAIYTTARLGLAGGITGELPRLLGRTPITVRQYIEDYRAAWE